MPKTTNVPARLLTGDDRVDVAMQTPGAFWYVKSNDGRSDAIMIHSCPCGCGMLGSLYITPALGRPQWSNVGTREKPTLTPSVGILPWNANDLHPRRAEKEADGYHWHGWLKDGVWISV